MFSSAKTSYRNKPRRPLRYVGFLLLVPFFLIGALFVLSSVRVVPPISTKVVDAITGKPVPGMSVCLQVEGMNLGGLEGLRTDMSRTSASGRVFFWPSVHASLLPAWRGYWIRVTDPDAQIAPPCGSYIAWMDLRAKGWPINLGPDENGRPKYFPVALLRGEPDPYFSRWRAMHRAMGFPVVSRIALIPVLPNASDCKQIPDPSLAEDCRQLNTYATAMSLRKKDDPESWALAETLCDEVDHAYSSAWCKGVFRGATRSQQAIFVTVRQPPATPTGPPPEIDSVTPETGVPGVTDVTIRGRHFGETQGDSFVSVGNLNGIVKRWTDTEIVATVDEHARRGVVSVFRDRQYGNAIPFTPAGLFIDAVSGMPTPGNQINIHGSGFESERGSGYVTIADIKAQVVQWSSTEIIVTVPDFSPTGWTFQLAIHQDGKSAEFRLISPQKSAVK